ncbi:hypothetical protein EDD29_2045 [Actinocorallia herbida]|uniref:Uncharacterized protein n=1 Tax=Actinocorallia herbida TaxID=58109 RepID=A0A3N1CUY6_9ACTN|nr:hypothetical protein [Actinocorallia herbida]ROO84518.1 hypothetical protein EDD29_2045 [Actinocorallia herbida]
MKMTFAGAAAAGGALALVAVLGQPAQAVSYDSVKLVVTSASGKAIYLEHHIAKCKSKTNCTQSGKDGTTKTAKYTQTIKVRKDRSVWVSTTALNKHRVRVYVNGKLVRDRNATWQGQDDAGFYISDLYIR